MQSVPPKKAPLHVLLSLRKRGRSLSCHDHTMTHDFVRGNSPTGMVQSMQLFQGLLSVYSLTIVSSKFRMHSLWMHGNNEDEKIKDQTSLSLIVPTRKHCCISKFGSIHRLCHSDYDHGVICAVCCMLCAVAVQYPGSMICMFTLTLTLIYLKPYHPFLVMWQSPTLP
jgi:hypothetical protein